MAYFMFNMNMKCLRGKVLVLFNNTVSVTEKTLDYLWQKQNVITNNIANQSTPGYKSQFMTFEDELRKNFQKQNVNSAKEYTNSINNSEIRLHVKEDEYYGLDGNTVNADVEQIELASVQIQYQAAVNDLSAEFSRLRAVIR